MKKIMIWFLCMIVMMQIAFAGVTNPLPSELNLFKGESGRFKFQVQTVASNQEVECTASLAGESPLIVEFDPATIIVPAGTVRDVLGTVTVPDGVEYGTYEENFCISCAPTESLAGTSVKVDTCDLPIKVNVVSERARDNMYIPPKPFPLFWKIVLIAAVVVIAAAIIILLLRKKRSKRLEKIR